MNSADSYEVDWVDRETREVRKKKHSKMYSADSHVAYRLNQSKAMDCLEQIKDALEAIHLGIEPEWYCVAWPSCLGQDVLNQLHLKARTYNSLARRLLSSDGESLIVEDLLSLRGFGLATLTDLLLCLENYFLQQIGAAPNERKGSVAEGSWRDNNANTENGNPILTSLEWDELVRLLGPVLSAGTELDYWNDLTDVLSPKFLILSQAFGILPEIKAFQLGALTDEWPSLKSTLAAKAKNIYEDFSDVEKIVVGRRLLAQPPWTLNEVGTYLGLTRERVRQIQQGVQTKIKRSCGVKLKVLAEILKMHFGPVVDKKKFQLALQDVNYGESAESRALLSYAIEEQLGYERVVETYFSPEGLQELTEIEWQARAIADEASLIDEEALKDNLSGSVLLDYWNEVLECCGFYRHYGVLALRNSMRVRTKAALVSIGRPATKEEIANICGIPPQRVSSYLSALAGVVRADSQSWGLPEWVDDIYEGIPKEIIQRIEEDGGITTVERLMREIPAKFDVKENSVWIYLNTLRFNVHEGYVSMADVSSIKYRPLEDVINGRNEEGEPYWHCKVDERFYRGFSVTGVPPEFAHALGCEPDGHIKVQVVNLPDCRDLSVNWNLSSNTGASIGFVSDSLLSLDAKEGDTVRITIKASGQVSLTLEDFESKGQHNADSLLEKIKNRGIAI